jgi:hypothetical protein
MGVKFDTAACMTAFRAHVIKTLLVAQEEYKVLAESHMLTPEGREDLTSEEITVLGDFVMANVSGGAWAVMDEMGKGSLMDMENPALDEYRNSDLWNPARYDTTIRSRERGSYVNIFGEMVYSNSNVGGINLEQKGGKFAPQPPSHAMQTAARWMMNGRIQTIWREAMQAFPWGNYIVVTPD